MQKVHDGLEKKDFAKPNSIVTAEVCADSGLIATEICKKDRRGDRTKSEIFEKGSVPKEECTLHKYATVCPDSFKLANPTCINTVGTINIVCIDRQYDEAPSKLPKDYEYEIPTSYCEYHFCEVDEYGNFIDRDPIYKEDEYDFDNWVDINDDEYDLNNENNFDYSGEN